VGLTGSDVTSAVTGLNERLAHFLVLPDIDPKDSTSFHSTNERLTVNYSHERHKKHLKDQQTLKDIFSL